MSNTSSQPVRRKSGSVTPPDAKRALPNWIDWLVLAAAVGISGVSIYSTVQAGALTAPLSADTLWAWHLVRVCGMVSYSLLAGSTLWGIFLSSHIIKDWAPGPLSLLLHAATSWLAVIFAIAHAVLLLFDSYYHYGPTDLIVPFTGPYRPVPVGLGIIGLWLTLVITISFSLRRLIGQRRWQLLHYTSYAAFGLITVHALLAGTDAAQPGLQIVLGGFALGVTALLIVRIVPTLKRKHS